MSSDVSINQSTKFNYLAGLPPTTTKSPCTPQPLAHYYVYTLSPSENAKLDIIKTTAITAVYKNNSNNFVTFTPDEISIYLTNYGIPLGLFFDSVAIIGGAAGYILSENSYADIDLCFYIKQPVQSFTEKIRQEFFDLIVKGIREFLIEKFKSKQIFLDQSMVDFLCFRKKICINKNNDCFSLITIGDLELKFIITKPRHNVFKSDGFQIDFRGHVRCVNVNQPCHEQDYLTALNALRTKILLIDSPENVSELAFRLMHQLTKGFTHDNPNLNFVVLTQILSNETDTLKFPDKFQKHHLNHYPNNHIAQNADYLNWLIFLKKHSHHEKANTLLKHITQLWVSTNNQDPLTNLSKYILKDPDSIETLLDIYLAILFLNGKNGENTIEFYPLDHLGKPRRQAYLNSNGQFYYFTFPSPEDLIKHYIKSIEILVESENYQPLNSTYNLETILKDLGAKNYSSSNLLNALIDTLDSAPNRQVMSPNGQYNPRSFYQSIFNQLAPIEKNHVRYKLIKSYLQHFQTEPNAKPLVDFITQLTRCLKIENSLLNHSKLMDLSLLMQNLVLTDKTLTKWIEDAIIFISQTIVSDQSIHNYCGLSKLLENSAKFMNKAVHSEHKHSLQTREEELLMTLHNQFNEDSISPIYSILGKSTHTLSTWLDHTLTLLSYPKALSAEYNDQLNQHLSLLFKNMAICTKIADLKSATQVIFALYKDNPHTLDRYSETIMSLIVSLFNKSTDIHFSKNDQTNYKQLALQLVVRVNKYTHSSEVKDISDKAIHQNIEDILLSDQITKSSWAQLISLIGFIGQKENEDAFKLLASDNNIEQAILAYAKIKSQTSLKNSYDLLLKFINKQNGIPSSEVWQLAISTLKAVPSKYEFWEKQQKLLIPDWLASDCESFQLYLSLIHLIILEQCALKDVAKLNIILNHLLILLETIPLNYVSSNPEELSNLLNQLSMIPELLPVIEKLALPPRDNLYHSAHLEPLYTKLLLSQTKNLQKLYLYLPLCPHLSKETLATLLDHLLESRETYYQQFVINFIDNSNLINYLPTKSLLLLVNVLLTKPDYNKPLLFTLIDLLDLVILENKEKAKLIPSIIQFIKHQYPNATEVEQLKFIQTLKNKYLACINLNEMNKSVKETLHETILQLFSQYRVLDFILLLADFNSSKDSNHQIKITIQCLKGLVLLGEQAFKTHYDDILRLFSKLIIEKGNLHVKEEKSILDVFNSLLKLGPTKFTCPIEQKLFVTWLKGIATSEKQLAKVHNDETFNDKMIKFFDAIPGDDPEFKLNINVLKYASKIFKGTYAHYCSYTYYHKLLSKDVISLEKLEKIQNQITQEIKLNNFLINPTFRLTELLVPHFLNHNQLIHAIRSVQVACAKINEMDFYRYSAEIKLILDKTIELLENKFISKPSLYSILNNLNNIIYKASATYPKLMKKLMLLLIDKESHDLDMLYPIIHMLGAVDRFDILSEVKNETHKRVLNHLRTLTLSLKPNDLKYDLCKTICYYIIMAYDMNLSLENRAHLTETLIQLFKTLIPGLYPHKSTDVNDILKIHFLFAYINHHNTIAADIPTFKEITGDLLAALSSTLSKLPKSDVNNNIIVLKYTLHYLHKNSPEYVKEEIETILKHYKSCSTSTESTIYSTFADRVINSDKPDINKFYINEDLFTYTVNVTDTTLIGNIVLIES